MSSWITQVRRKSCAMHELNKSIDMEVVVKKILTATLLFLVTGSLFAGVIPKSYHYVDLPYEPELASFQAFTDINARGYAVGFGQRDGKTIGFVFNYYTDTVEMIIDNFWPAAINDNNTIIGVSTATANLPLQECLFNNNTCPLRAVEGAERTLPFRSMTITNSDIINGLFYINSPDMQQKMYQAGQLIYSEPVTGGLSSPDMIIKDTQMNNTQLAVGARLNTNGVYRPIVKVRVSTGLTELALPIPDDVAEDDPAVATSVNTRNEIVLHVRRGPDRTQIYTCGYLGDSDNDGVAECAGGLRLISDGSSLRGVPATPTFEGSFVPVNDKGLMLAPAQKDGESLRFYDLTQDMPIAVPITSFGNNIGVFLYGVPLDVENNGAALISAAQTVIFVPDESPEVVVESSAAVEPIILGSDGGRLYMTDRIVNKSGRSLKLYIWRVLMMPDGTPMTVGRLTLIELASGETYETNRTRTSLRPYDSKGEYRYVFYVKDTSAGEVYSDEVRIVKQ